MNDQSAKADGGKLRLTLVPMDAVEAVAAIRMFGVQKYVEVDNWKRVEKDRYKDAALRHFIRYTREPYGMDDESNLPHLWHCLCNLFFLCALEIEDGTLPQPQDAVKKMTRCEPVQARRSPGTGAGGYIYEDEIKTPGKGVERVCNETVDAVPVVRCADCIRYRPDGEVWGRCTVMVNPIRKKDFCSYGVPKDGGDD